MTDLEIRIRAALEDDAAGAPPPARAPLRRTWRRQVLNVAAAGSLAVALFFVVGLGASAFVRGRGTERVESADVPPGSLASVRVPARDGVVDLTASGTTDGRLCLRVSQGSREPVTSCLTRGDLEQTTVTAFVAELDHGAVTYGVTAIDVVRVELRSTEHRWRTARLREVSTVSPNVRVFILVSGHHIERGALVGLGAAGTTIGEPTWVLWGAATVPGDGIECLCSEIAQRHDQSTNPAGARLRQPTSAPSPTVPA